MPAGLKGGQDFLAKIPDGPEMLVTVPAGVGPGSHIAIVEPRRQSLAFGDAAHFKNAAAAAREGRVRRGVEPDFVKPLGDLGETGLYEKKSALQGEGLGKDRGVPKRLGSPGDTIDRSNKMEAARKEDDLAADLAKSEAWAEREARELHPARDSFDADEEMRAAGVRHGDGYHWMAMKAARTQSLLSKGVHVVNSKAHTAAQEIAAERKRAEELEREWVRKRVSEARRERGIKSRPTKSKIESAMALLHAEQEAKVSQAIDIVHAADKAVRYASPGGLARAEPERAAKSSSRHTAAPRGATATARPTAVTPESHTRKSSLESDVEALEHRVLAKIAQEHAEVAPQMSAQHELLAAAPGEGAVSLHATQASLAMAARKEDERLVQQAERRRAVSLIARPQHLSYKGDPA